MANDREPGRGSPALGGDKELLASLRAAYLGSAMRKSEGLVLLLCGLVARQDLISGRSDALLASDPSPDPQLLTTPEADANENLLRAGRAAHNLVGSGASYGLPGITVQARKIEETLKHLSHDAESRLDALLDALVGAVYLFESIKKAHDGEVEPLLQGEVEPLLQPEEEMPDQS